MCQKERIKERVARMFAAAEIETDTPRARKAMSPYLDNSIFDSLSEDDAETVINDIAQSYTGDEDVTDLLNSDAVQYLVERLCGGIPLCGVKTLRDAIERVYGILRDEKIKEIKEHMAEWNIGKDDLFPEVFCGH